MTGRLSKPNGFTLTEMLAVVLMIAIMGGVVFSVFVTNWEALDDQIARSNLWHQANEIVETMTADGRLAKAVVVMADDGQGNQVTDFIDRDNMLIATYKITPDGRLLMERAGTSKVLSDRIDPAGSVFLKDATTGSGLRVRLTLSDELLRRAISVSTATEIFPRNINSPIIGTPST